MDWESVVELSAQLHRYAEVAAADIVAMIQLPLPDAGEVGNAAVRVAGVIHGLKLGLVVSVC